MATFVLRSTGTTSALRGGDTLRASSAVAPSILPAPHQVTVQMVDEPSAVAW